MEKAVEVVAGSKMMTEATAMMKGEWDNHSVDKLSSLFLIQVCTLCDEGDDIDTETGTTTKREIEKIEDDKAEF